MRSANSGTTGRYISIISGGRLLLSLVSFYLQVNKLHVLDQCSFKLKSLCSLYIIVLPQASHLLTARYELYIYIYIYLGSSYCPHPQRVSTTRNQIAIVFPEGPQDLAANDYYVGITLAGICQVFCPTSTFKQKFMRPATHSHLTTKIPYLNIYLLIIIKIMNSSPSGVWI